ncbi:kinase-like domain-containing protein, partial [Mycena galericulata]
IYSILGPHPRIVECLNENIYLLPVETRYEVAKTEPLRFTTAPHGDLMRYLFTHPDVPPQLRAKWGLQIAEGIAFVHSRNIVWADCNPENLLLTADLDILLCDFGGSAFDGQRADVAPPMRYCDPTVPYSDNFSRGKKVDVFAFGCVFLEILTYNAVITPGCLPELHRGGGVCAFSRCGLAIN